MIDNRLQNKVEELEMGYFDGDLTYEEMVEEYQDYVDHLREQQGEAQ